MLTFILMDLSFGHPRSNLILLANWMCPFFHSTNKFVPSDSDLGFTMRDKCVKATFKRILNALVSFI